MSYGHSLALSKMGITEGHGVLDVLEWLYYAVAIITVSCPAPNSS